MSKGKTIENPEVPGFEENLPPPLPSSLSKRLEPTNTEKIPFISEEIRLQVDPYLIDVLPPPPPPPPPPEINAHDAHGNYQMMQPQYYVPPAIQHDQTGPPHVPWWIPTPTDAAELYPQWPDNQNKIIPTEPPNNSTIPPLKRKIEPIDHVRDAETVAGAQSELSALMKPLKCDLCNAVMNSTLQAKLHYEGKPHQKKVSMFLNQSAKKLKTDDGHVTTTANNWSTYCEVCKTWFTSQADATQHYAGKKHIRATTGAPKPKTPKKNSDPQVPIDPTGRFGIGTSFQLDNPGVSIIPEVPVAPPIPGFSNSPLYNPVATTYTGALRCDICGVTANRLEQLETHRRGTRHQKMLRLNGMTLPETVTPNENLLTTTSMDYSIYRTPSGSYYCAPCDKSFTSENSFIQHVESKKHKNQINPKSSGNQSQKLSKKLKIKKNKT